MADTTKKKHSKTQFNIFFIFSFLLTICFGIETILVLFFILCDFFNLFNVSLFLSTIFKDKELLTVEKLQTLQNIYTPFFVGFIAAYFTVLSIFLGRKQELGFKSCIKYMAISNLLRLHFSFLLINFFIIEFSFSVFCYSPFTELYTEDAILQLLWTFAVGVYNMTYMEDENKATNLLSKYLNKKNKNRFLDCFNNFISKSFPKQKFEIYRNTFELYKEKDSNQLFIKLTKKISTMDEANSKDYQGFIKVFVKHLYRLLAPNRLSKIDFDSVESNYDMLFSLILQTVRAGKLEKSYLLEAREPLYFFIDLRIESGEVPKEIEIIVNKMLDYCKQIIITSLYNCKYEVASKEIEDFLGINLPLEIKNFPSELINKHTKYAMDLITWIFNLIQFKKIKSDYLTLIPNILTSFEYRNIMIFDFDTEMYDEGVNPGNMHTIIYNRNYYIAMLLLWCEVTKKFRTSELIGKFRYAGASKDDTGWEYKNVLRGLKNIVKADFISVMPDYVSEFDNAKGIVTALLNSRIAKKEEQNMDNIKKSIDYEKIKNAISIRKQQFMAEFNSFAEKTSDYVQLRPIPTEFDVSYREIERDTSLHVFHSDYYPLFKEILLAKFINSSNSKIKNVLTLLDIPCDDGETLLLSHIVYAKLCYIKEIQFSEDSSIHYGNKDFKIEYIQSALDGIILKSDFCKAFSKPEINDSDSKLDKQETSLDITFITYADVIFSQNLNIDLLVYRVQEIANIKMDNIEIGGN